MRRVMVIAAHPDDEVLGCGGTIARHVHDGDEVHLLFVADGETSRIQAGKPNRNLEALAASKILGTQPPVFLDLLDQKLDIYPLLEVTQLIEAQVNRVSPSIVYTHAAFDLNLDHRIVHQAVMTALRPLPENKVGAIFAFEVPSSTEWGGGFRPNFFINIESFVMKKLDAMFCYKGELRDFPHPRSRHMIYSHAEIRGTSAGFACAEAFEMMRGIQ